MAGRETQTHRSKKLREQQETCIITLKTLTHHIQTGKTNKKGKETILRAKKKKDTLTEQEKNKISADVLVTIHASKKILKVTNEKTKLSTQNSIHGENILQKRWKIETMFQQNKQLKEFDSRL